MVCYGSCSECPVYGCIDSLAINFDALATQDDGSCSYVSGCTDSSALNYDQGATEDDGSCQYGINVTFQVDMAQQDVSESGVHIAGDFQGWYPDATAMSDDDGDNIYTITIALAPNTSYEYKFVNGNAWGLDEYVLGDCSVEGGNRLLTTTDIDLIIPMVCYGSCSECPVSGCTDSLALNYVQGVVEDDGSCQYGISVTFQVDMAQQDVSESGVHIAGDFQGWDPAATAMIDDDGDNIYSITLALAPNTSYEYKFVNGNTWGLDEYVLGDCSVEGGNRLLTTTDIDLIIPKVCYSSCSECPVYGCIDSLAINFDALATQDDGSCSYVSGCTDSSALNCQSGATEDDGSCQYPINITFQVDMTLQQVSSDGVHIAGDFQGWDPSTSEMSNVDGDLYHHYSISSKCKL